MSIKLSPGIIIILSVSSMFLGCAGVATEIPGSIVETTSSSDGVKQITIEPALLYNSPIKLSLTKTSEMPPEYVVLEVLAVGKHNFSPGESLLSFNIDGQTFSFKSLDTLVYIPPFNRSSKSYLISKDFIKRLIDGEKVWIKVDLVKTSVEGEFSTDAPGTARPAFREFYNRISKW